MNASVILIAYHGDRWLPDCLASLAEAGVRPLHLVLVDNAGNTILDELDLQAFDAEVLSAPHPMGFAEANNFALVQASRLEDTVLFLNQDTISSPGWIDRCLAALARDDALGAVSPLIRTYEDDGWDPSFLDCLTVSQRGELAQWQDAYAGDDRDHPPSRRSAPRFPLRRETRGQSPTDEAERSKRPNAVRGKGNVGTGTAHVLLNRLPDGAPDHTAPVMYTRNAPAPALLVQTDVLRAAGPFDPVFGSYYEDYDLCRRIRATGYRIGFCRDAHIRHFSGGSTTTPAQERRRMRQIIRNRVLYRLRETDAPRWRRALRWILRDFPRRLARGLVGTPSSQPPTVTLRAYADLLRLGRRVVSRAYDEAAWQAYLDELGWPPREADLETAESLETAEESLDTTEPNRTPSPPPPRGRGPG